MKIWLKKTPINKISNKALKIVRFAHLDLNSFAIWTL